MPHRRTLLIVCVNHSTLVFGLKGKEDLEISSVQRWEVRTQLGIENASIHGFTMVYNSVCHIWVGAQIWVPYRTTSGWADHKCTDGLEYLGRNNPTKYFHDITDISDNIVCVFAKGVIP